jgi:hypothetical protein
MLVAADTQAGPAGSSVAVNTADTAVTLQLVAVGSVAAVEVVASTAVAVAASMAVVADTGKT